MGTVANRERHKLWLSEVAGPENQPLLPGRKVSLVLFILLSFQENPEIQIWG